MSIYPVEIENFLSQYKYKIELHAHTSPVSPCSELVPREFIDRLKSKGYDAVVVTNHFFPWGPFMKEEDPVGAYLADFEEARRIGEEEGIAVLLGAEFRFEENNNDYLVFGVDEAFLRETVKRFDLSFRAFYEIYHADNRLICQAHPFRNGIVAMDGAHMDGIEAFNMHPGHNSRICTSAQYADEQNIPILLIGTDLHHRGHEGSAALRAKTLPKNNDELVALLRSGDYIFEIGGRPLLPYYTF